MSEHKKLTLPVLCPECGIPMVVRTNRKTNQQFLGCSNYPKCKCVSSYAVIIEHDENGNVVSMETADRKYPRQICGNGKGYDEAFWRGDIGDFTSGGTW